MYVHVKTASDLFTTVVHKVTLMWPGWTVIYELLLILTIKSMLLVMRWLNLSHGHNLGTSAQVLIMTWLHHRIH